jgi:hypothetical protein
MSSIVTQGQATTTRYEQPDGSAASQRLTHAYSRLQMRDFGGRASRHGARYEGDDVYALPHRDGAGTPDADLQEAPEPNAPSYG